MCVFMYVYVDVYTHTHTHTHFMHLHVHVHTSFKIQKQGLKQPSEKATEPAAPVNTVCIPDHRVCAHWNGQEHHTIWQKFSEVS
jgi:hypothetical protein